MRLLILAVLSAFAIPIHAQELPSTQVTDIYSGKKLAFRDIPSKGKVTLISFWATWCVPGKQEVKTILPHLPEWKKLLDLDYNIIAVDQQGSEDRVRTYVKEQGWTIPCYLNANSELKRDLGFLALPEVIIIDRAGKIVFSHNGFIKSDQIAAKLKEIAHAEPR